MTTNHLPGLIICKTFDSRDWTPLAFWPSNAKLTLKELQDHIAEMDPEILARNIYTVITEAQWKEFYDTGFWNAKAVGK